MTELQLQLNKEDVYIWNRIVQEVLVMNRFYHFQSQKEKKKKPPNVSIDTGVKSVVFEIKSIWLDFQPAELCLSQDLTRMALPLS